MQDSSRIQVPNPPSLDFVQDSKSILRVNDLKMYFPIFGGVLLNRIGEVKALDGVSFTLKDGETLGIVGESGCGKSTLGRTIVRLYQPTTGDIWYKTLRGAIHDLSIMSRSELRPIRSEIQMIFQDPYSSLNPRMTVGEIIGEPMALHKPELSRYERNERVAWLLKKVGLSQEQGYRYPHEFSGGQRQRIGIARSLATQPRLIIADEPVSALDVSIQAQVINLLQELQEEFNLTYIFIAHDLAVVRHISNRIAVMYLGNIMEFTDGDALYNNPLHPYTRSLLSAIPVG